MMETTEDRSKVGTHGFCVSNTLFMPPKQKRTKDIFLSANFHRDFFFLPDNVYDNFFGATVIVHQISTLSLQVRKRQYRGGSKLL